MEEIEYPEWLPETADMEWDELSDEQKEFFENYRARLDEEHKDLAVKPKDPRSTLLFAAMKDDATKAEAVQLMAKTVVHAMSYDKHGSKGPGVYCTCGLHKIHRRGKVLATWADRHHTKTGHMWAGGTFDEPVADQ